MKMSGLVGKEAKAGQLTPSKWNSEKKTQYNLTDFQNFQGKMKKFAPLIFPKCNFGYMPEDDE